MMRVWIIVPWTGRRQSFPRSLINILLFCVVISLILISYLFLFSSFQFDPTDYPDLIHDKLSYGVVIDCGSSGSRVFVYFWTPHDGHPHKLLKIQILNDKSNKPIVMKIEPGLSSFVNKPIEIGIYLFPLLNFAMKYVPENKIITTPLYVLATAGMRLLPENIQKALIDSVYQNISSNFNFLFPRTHIEVISGKLEGIFSWISVNYALGKFDQNILSSGDKLIAVEVSDVEKLHIRKRTVGILDLGGASLQMAFELPNTINLPKNPDIITEFNLGYSMESQHLKYRLYVSTYLGYGSNFIREKYISLLSDTAYSKINESEKEDYSSLQLFDPCLLKGKEEDYFEDGRKIKIFGIGNFSQCIQNLIQFVRNPNCTHKKCILDGSKLMPEINFRNSEFFGFSEFYYTMEDILDIGGKYDHIEFKRKAEEYCHTNWNEVESWKNATKHPKADYNRYLLQCFKSAWMIQVLHEGLKFPYFYKHLTSLSGVDGFIVHWSLGAILYKTKYFPLRDIENNLATQHLRTHRPNLDLIMSPVFDLLQSPIIFISIILILLLIIYCVSLGFYGKKTDSRDKHPAIYSYQPNYDDVGQSNIIRSRSAIFTPNLT